MTDGPGRVFAAGGPEPLPVAIRLEIPGDEPGIRAVELAADLRTVGATTAWLLRAGSRTALRAARLGGRAAVAGAGVVARGAGVAAQGAARAAGSTVGAVRKRLARRLRGNDPDALAIEPEGDGPRQTRGR